MLRRHRKNPSLRVAIGLFASINRASHGATGALVVSGLCLVSACSFHAGFGTSTGSNTTPRAQNEPQPAARTRRVNTQERENQPVARSRRHVRTQAEADDELATVDREARERVAQAEREAEEQERAAEAEAERARQQADAERAAAERDAANQAAAAQAGANRSAADRAGAAQAANQADANRTAAGRVGAGAMTARAGGSATTAPAQTPAQSGASDASKAGSARRDEPGRIFIHKNADPTSATAEQNAIHDRFTHTNDEINKTAIEKKTIIRKRLEQNKADILVAAERKRNEIHAALKQDAAEKR